MSMELELQEALLDDGSPSPRPPTPILPSEDGEAGEGDSSSTGSVIPADAVSAQLINNITMLDYHSLGKTTALIGDSEELGNGDGMGIGQSSGQLPHFVSWNWPLIRKVLFWGVLSALFACVAAVVATVATLPKTCNPTLPWYQGQLFYEIFPASFHDSNGDGIGDLKGLSKKADYIKELGVKVIHLNSIFQSYHYPEHYHNISSLINIDKALGTPRDFALLSQTLHSKNISLIIDLPIHNFIHKLEADSIYHEKLKKLNVSEIDNIHKQIKDIILEENPVTTAIKYWNENDVDGFYIKGTENLVNNPYFQDFIKKWKEIIGINKILMLSYETILNIEEEKIDEFLPSVDLIDVFIDVSNGSQEIKKQADSIISSVLWSKPGFPWVHWSVGNINSRRLSSKLPQNNTLSALLLSMMLPGSPSIFYGDEISLQEISEPEEDFHESKTIHNLTPMKWPDSEFQFTHGEVLPWITGRDIQTKHMPFENVDIISLFADIRTKAAPIYLNSILKEGLVLPNTQLRYSNIVILVERWYPRKNSYVFVSNFGSKTFKADLSSWFYGGTVVVSSNRDLEGKEVFFKPLTLVPAEAIVIRLEK